MVYSSVSKSVPQGSNLLHSWFHFGLLIGTPSFVGKMIKNMWVFIDMK